MASRITPSKLFMVGIMAIIGIYLWGQFTVDSEFVLPGPAELETSTLGVLKLLIIGVAVFLGYTVMMKFTGGVVSQKDLITLVILGIIIFFMWDRIVSNIFNAETLGDISFKTAQKLGLG